MHQARLRREPATRQGRRGDTWVSDEEIARRPRDLPALQVHWRNPKEI